MPEQLSLLPEAASRQGDYRDSMSGSFVGNMELPVHRWFRYSAGFSGAWAEAVIAAHAKDRPTVFDPFAGCGTTLIAAERRGAECWGIDSHPFVARVARAKLAYRSSLAAYRELALQVLANAGRRQPSLAGYPRSFAGAIGTRRLRSSTACSARLGKRATAAKRRVSFG